MLFYVVLQDGGDPVTDLKTFFSKVGNELPGEFNSYYILRVSIKLLGVLNSFC